MDIITALENNCFKRIFIEVHTTVLVKYGALYAITNILFNPYKNCNYDYF